MIGGHSWTIPRSTIRIMHFTLGPIKPWQWWAPWIADECATWQDARAALYLQDIFRVLCGLVLVGVFTGFLGLIGVLIVRILGHVLVNYVGFLLGAVGIIVSIDILSIWFGITIRLLVKESFGTAAAGLAFVLTCVRGKPLAYHSARRVAAASPAESAEWEELAKRVNARDWRVLAARRARRDAR